LCNIFDESISEPYFTYWINSLLNYLDKTSISKKIRLEVLNFVRRNTNLQFFIMDKSTMSEKEVQIQAEKYNFHISFLY